MWQRVLLGAAMAGVAWLVVERQSENKLVAGAHALPSVAFGFDVISSIIEREYARFGTESRCQVTGNVACLLTTRRAHAQIAAALRGLHRSEVTLLAYV